jgi:dTDP-glucose pyrophosphorylase/CBS domain-containing protein
VKAELDGYLVAPQCSIRDAMVSIDRNAGGIVFVVDEEQHLLGTVSDGDVRRAILRGITLDQPLQELLGSEPRPNRMPVVASQGTAELDLLKMMNERSVRQIPILAADGRVVDVSFLDDLVKNYELPLRAIVMAGGYGVRLRPLTDETPKPMLPVGGRPLLQHTIEQLKKSGIQRVDLSTHYKADVIANHFGDGHDFGLQIEYIHEDSPLGTAGALRGVNGCEGPLLVINGDILTQVNFRALLDYHREHEALLTVGVRQYQVQVPYGVVECEGSMITGISEKPKISFFVNAGIYLLDPRARNYIPSGQRFDMTDLIQPLVEDRCSVVSFPIVEYWLDIGSPLDYEQAQLDATAGRIAAKVSPSAGLEV